MQAAGGGKAAAGTNPGTTLNVGNHRFASNPLSGTRGGLTGLPFIQQQQKQLQQFNPLLHIRNNIGSRKKLVSGEGLVPVNLTPDDSNYYEYQPPPATTIHVLPGYKPVELHPGPKEGSISAELKAFLERQKADEAYLDIVESSYSYNSILTTVGLWWLWNTYLVNIIPRTILLDLFNAATGKRRDLEDSSLLGLKTALTSALEDLGIAAQDDAKEEDIDTGNNSKQEEESGSSGSVDTTKEVQQMLDRFLSGFIKTDKFWQVLPDWIRGKGQ